MIKLMTRALVYLAFGASLLLISSLFRHQDLDVVLWLANFVTSDNWFNIYQSVADASPKALAMIGYGPVVYWLFAIWVNIGRFLFDLFSLTGWGEPMPLSSVEYLWAKLLYVPFLIIMVRSSMGILALLTARTAPGPVSWYLLTQPVVLFISFVMGQLDIISAALVLLGGYRFLSGKFITAGILFALATLTKNWPAPLFVGWTVLTLLLHPDFRERLRACYGLACFSGTLGLLLGMVWGNPLKQTYLAFNNQGYVYARVDLPWMPFNIYLYALIIALVVLFLSSPFRVQIVQFLMVFINRVARGVADLLTWRQTIFWSTLIYLGLILFNRVWMPQYLVWISPWICIAVLFNWQRFANGSLAYAWAGLQAVYLFIVPLYWINGVDSSMYLLQHHDYTLGMAIGDLLGTQRPVWAWMVFSAFFIYLIGRGLAEMVVLIEAIPSNHPSNNELNVNFTFLAIYHIVLMLLIITAFLLLAYQMF